MFNFNIQKIKYLISGIVIGIVLSTPIFSFAGLNESDVISLFVNGRQISSDVPAQLISGRVLVPARPLAEALGATVTWDNATNSVIITTNNNSISGEVYGSSDASNTGSQSTQDQSTQVTQPESPQPYVQPDIKVQPITDTNNVTKTTFNDMKAIVVNGQTYFSGREYSQKYPNNIFWDSKTGNTSIKGVIIPYTDVNFQIYLGQSYFHVKYF